MKRAGIIGVSGYTGLELVKILRAHKGFEISYLAATSEGRIDETFPQLTGILDIKIEVADPKTAAQRCDVVFLALPHEKAMEFASAILEFGTTKVVDLSADYRLSLALYEKNYTTHLDPKNLAHAVYGLVELNKEKIKTANLVANPGCYPTSIALGLAPALKNRIVSADGKVVRSKSYLDGPVG